MVDILSRLPVPDVLHCSSPSSELTLLSEAGRRDVREHGVRIEDEYLITETGLERRSDAPREIAEIEALMKKRQRPVP